MQWLTNLKIWGVLGAILAVLLGMLKIQSIRIGNKTKEIEELKTEVEITKEIAKTDAFQEANIIAKEEFIDESIDDIRLSANTTYRL